MNPQTQEQQQQMLNAMAQPQLGPAQQPAQPAPPPEKDTAMDKATAQGSPQTEGDKMQEAPVTYKVKFADDDERELTQQQIVNMTNRYAQLNQMQSFMRPVLMATAEMMAQNPGMTPEQVVQHYRQLANTPNRQMGGQDQRPNQQGNQNQGMSAADISKQFEQWEKDNAASLPPGYKELFQNTSQMQQGMQKMMQMMVGMANRTQGVADASKMAVQDARGQTINATRQRIANNLNSVQQKLGLGDDALEPFKMFAAERGYTMEDFVDPMMALRVGNDFKNAMQSGELQRLQSVNQRRQAFTGSVGQQPSGGPGAQPQTDQNLEAMINRALGGRT